jgi:hypothetical protein
LALRGAEESLQVAREIPRCESIAGKRLCKLLEQLGLGMKGLRRSSFQPDLLIRASSFLPSAIRRSGQKLEVGAAAIEEDIPP